MRLLFLIPARGGSKGLPRKNLAILGGIPLVGRTARLARLAARALGPGCRVVCSTDDPVIAEAARTWGAEVPFLRPAELASDSAQTSDVVLHALAECPDCDTVALLQPTSPLTTVEDLLGALALFCEGGGPVVSVCPTEHPAQWLFTLGEDGRLDRVLVGTEAHQRQQATATYRPNGAVYLSNAESFRSASTFYTAETRGYVMPSARSVDVDTAQDLEVARALVACQPVEPVEIGGRRIGPGAPCFLIAEAGVNHNGDLGMALRLVDVAAAAGADAVKFQTFRPERLVTRQAPKAEYQLRTTGANESQYEMLKRLELNEEAHRALMERCAQRGVLFLSTPFDEESCDLLDGLGLPAFKLPSGELTNLPLLRHAARKGKPLLISTGMATLEETAAAVDAVRDEGCRALILLHCVSNYPADPADCNLRAVRTLREAFGVTAGFSDHTEGEAVALAAVALGASLVEKHFTLDRTLPGPDHQASVEPAELASLVRQIRTVESSLGQGAKVPAASEAPVARVARKSLVSSSRIPAGSLLERGMVAFMRPGTGLPPETLDGLLGKRALREIPEGTLLDRGMFE